MFERYAIYYTPDGALAKIGAAWLGWDLAAGEAVSQPEIAGIDVAAVTATPRKYGLHGTIKPPFRLSAGLTASDLEQALADHCARTAPITLDGLQVARLGAFVALVPAGDQADLAALASQTVETLDPFRAPASEAELARRRARSLTNAQETYLQRWGYPYVMDAFRFHITLSGALEDDTAEGVTNALSAHLAPVLSAPVRISDLTLVGEDANGMFHQIRRMPLKG